MTCVVRDDIMSRKGSEEEGGNRVHSMPWLLIEAFVMPCFLQVALISLRAGSSAAKGSLTDKLRMLIMKPIRVPLGISSMSHAMRE